VPLQIAFEPRGLESRSARAFNIFVDALFILDLVLSFRTTITSPLTGEEITKPRDIAIAYLKGRFVLDLISALPFEHMIGSGNL